MCSDYVLGFSDTKTIMEILLVIRDFQPRLMSYVKVLDGRNIIVYAVDEWVFERDVDRGFLGEALAGKMIFPYVSLMNGNYLHLQEVKLKKRLVLELLETLVLDFPELSYEFHIKPEYFVYETVLSRARLFPPMIHGLLNFMRKDVREGNIELVMRRFSEALKELEEENAVAISGGYVKISQKFADEVRSRKVRFINLFKTAQRTLFTSLLSIFPTALNVLSQNTETFLKFQRNAGENSKLIHQLEDPHRFLYVPTARGLVPLTSRMDIEPFAREVLSPSEDAEVKIEEIGGVLNDVYLVKAVAKDEERKIVVKRFRDWSSFKWFPLTLWALGTRTFAVLGRSRLERECAINQLLYSKGFAVPKILHVSHANRLVFMEYVEGENLGEVIKRIVNTKNHQRITEDSGVISKVGEKLAEVHALGIALGDTKPENLMVGQNGEIYMLDFEQASRTGDKVWDIAEFLYYAGHYVPPFIRTSSAELITKTFIQGYLKAGGDFKLVKKAGNPKYTKVFSIFTLPLIILAISNICKKTPENLAKKNQKNLQ
jgi:tRNA A-37 threonylcarbamoyl transferase component Bud32